MTIKAISGEELRNHYFVELRVKGYIHKDEQTKIESATYTLRLIGGQDKFLITEDVMEFTYAQGAPTTVWADKDLSAEDQAALMIHFTEAGRTSVDWLTEARTLATEWANGNSYDHADVDHRGLLVHGEDLLEIDE